MKYQSSFISDLSGNLLYIKKKENKNKVTSLSNFINTALMVEPIISGSEENENFTESFNESKI